MTLAPIRHPFGGRAQLTLQILQRTFAGAAKSAVGVAVLIAAVVVFSWVSLAPSSAEARQKRAHIVVDAQSGARLIGSRADARVHPASLTKMMTLYIVFDEIRHGKLSFRDKITISRRAAAAPRSKLGLRRGSKMTVLNAVRAAAVFSANDAAVALAERVAGSEAAFASLMTRRAKALGMHSTVFQNSTGLTDRNHYSTPRDMAILSRRLLLDFPQNYIVFGREVVKMHGKTRRATNGLLRVRNSIDGLKTGYTSAAGFNLAASEKRGRRRVIAIAFGESSRVRRDRRVLALLDKGFERLKQSMAVASAPRPTPRGGVQAASDYSIRSVAAQSSQRFDQSGEAGFGPSFSTAPRRDPRAKDRYASRSDDVQYETGSIIDSVRPRINPRAERSAAAANGAWSVQVGAFHKRRMADDRLSRVVAMNAPPLAAAQLRIEQATDDNALYRVRFSGLDRRGAAAACDWLNRRSVDCSVVPPGGWGG